MNKTSIPWCDYTWNPVTGCSKVSEGCRNCYAESIAKRFWGERKFTDVRMHPYRLAEPEKEKKPGKVFVCSMSDLFHDDVPDQFICDVWDIMQNKAPWHTYIILTKRPKRMMDILQIWECEGTSGVAENIWLGTSVENQRAADERLPYLLRTPAAKHIVSVEPMLENVKLAQNWVGYLPGWETDSYMDKDGDQQPMQVQTDKLAWVICGSESGSQRRPFDMDWARALRDQCQAASVPFFFKQAPVNRNIVEMPELDGVVWNQFPEQDN
jgi:protein gp37